MSEGDFILAVPSTLGTIEAIRVSVRLQLAVLVLAIAAWMALSGRPSST